MQVENYVYQNIAQSLKDHGVETIFGLMGDANLFMVDSFVRDCSGRFVPAAHEGSSVLMALAYTHVADKVGVATVTHGPALTNCMTALTEGARGHIPMVLLAGDTPVANPRHLQSIDQREVVKATGAGFEQMRTPETVAMDVARAFYRAQVERRPIVLNMPADFMWRGGGSYAQRSRCLHSAGRCCRRRNSRQRHRHDRLRAPPAYPRWCGRSKSP